MIQFCVSDLESSLLFSTTHSTYIFVMISMCEIERSVKEEEAEHQFSTDFAYDIVSPIAK